MAGVVICVGISHKQAPIGVREQLAVPEDQLAARLQRVRALPGVREAVLLSTCNRLEIFAAADDASSGDDLLRELGELAAPHARLHCGEDALRHLFRVAASLDSMVVGEAQILGQVKEAVARAQAAGAAELLVANRGAQRAEDLAREVGGVPVSLADLPALLERVDVAICSTGATSFVITHELMHRAAKARRYRPAFLIDLSLPRNIEPSVNQLENVYVYDLDDLEKVAAQNRDLRGSELASAEAIVEEELRALQKDLRERHNVPVLGRLRQHAQGLADAEVEKTLAALGPLSERQQKSVRAMAQAIVNKLLHAPTARLRDEAGDGPLADAAAQLFGIEEAQPPAAAAAAGAPPAGAAAATTTAPREERAADDKAAQPEGQ